MKHRSQSVSVCFGLVLLGLLAFATRADAQSAAACEGEEFRQLGPDLGADRRRSGARPGLTIPVVISPLRVARTMKGSGWT